ncbi:MAG: bifunctional UDP-N-acetylglucosamine diphosphorylase/glucosamine-1-phosphate N-acetyltransferase GlmU [Ruminiclostridium sp.]
MSFSAIILAAGDGTRMKSKKPKVMCSVLGEPMIGWVTDSVLSAGFSPENIGAVVGNGAETVREYLKTKGIETTFFQAERKGTGHAVMQAQEMADKAEDLLLLCGDAPFIDSETIIGALNEHTHSGNDVTVVTAEIENPFGYGRIQRDESGGLKGIVEQKNCTEEQAEIREINSGVYWFRSAALKAALKKLVPNSVTGEYYITDTVELILAAGGKAGAYKAANSDIVLGANSRSDLLKLNDIARMNVINRLMSEGVEFASTDGVIIGKDVSVGQDTVILPGTILRGSTVIGEDCVIGPNTLIENCTVGNGVVLNSVQAYSAKIRDRVKAGPFVHIRPGTTLHEGVKIGDFVEIKNSEIGVNTAVAHLTYVGDSDVGKGVNFGCGCVTANYDGVNKYRTVIGDYAFIGCNTNLIAPVEIGENATTAAGSTITRAVPPDSLAVERAQTRIIEHWQKNSKRIKKA